MAKRNADKELTDRNWDQEEEGEEAGTFSIASDDVLKNRAMKKAKRRSTAGETDDSATFKGFKGFSLTPSVSGAVTAAFSGFGNSGSFTGLTNGNVPSLGGMSATAPARTTGIMFDSSTSSDPAFDVKSKKTNGTTSQSSASCSSTEYNKQLTALNCSVRDWITKHVNDNPLCDLNPIFRDYERHLASIERKYGVGSADGGSEEKNSSSLPPPPAAAAPLSSSSSSTAAALFSFSKSPTEIKAPPGATFNFGQKVDSSVLASMGSNPSPSSFSFTSSSQSSLFGAGVAPSLSGTRNEDTRDVKDENEDEESEEPPKPEVKEIQEKDAFYSKKCKLFYKKDAEFKEKGVGTLHLKLTELGKTQLIIRADTNLGNILLNIIVQASIPCTRVGKNNVMLMCVPNPPVDEKNPNTVVPLLVRVKTAEDADELHKILEEKKS